MKQSINNLLTGGLLVILVALSSSSLFGQRIRNSGKLINLAGQTLNCSQFLNGKTGTGGTLINAGTVNVNKTGGFFNYDSINTNAAGIVRNYIGGTGAGLINSTGQVNNSQNGVFDNDSLGGYVGVIKVAGGYLGNGLTMGTNFDTDSGKVEFTGGTAMTLPAATYGAVVASLTNTLTEGGAVTVNDTLRIATGATMTVNGQTLTIKGANNSNSGTFTANGVGTVVNYAGNLDQPILASSYATLTTSGSTGAHTKTLASGVVITTALNVGANDTLAVTAGTLDLGTNNATLTNTPANASALKLGGTVTFGAAVTNAGNVVYGGAAQSIAATTYNDLYFRGTGAKTLGATVNVNGNFAATNSGGPNVYTGNTFTFSGSTAQAIAVPNEPFNVLQFSNGGAAAVKTVSGSFSANSVAISSGAYVSSSATMTIASGGLTVNSATSLTNSGSIGITGGDLVNDGTMTNSGSVTVN